MPDYKNMTATEALRHAKDVSGLTADEIAARYGSGGEGAEMSAAHIRRYLNRVDDYSPGLDKLPALCAALGNTVLLQWIEARLEREPQTVTPARTRAEVLTAAARISASLGEVQRVLADSEATGIDPACARAVRGLLHDVIGDARVAIAMLGHTASLRSKAQEILFCRRKKEDGVLARFIRWAKGERNA